MRSSARCLLAAVLGLVLSGPSMAVPDTDTVLIVVSGEGRDQGRARPGYEMDELSQAWLIFAGNGLAVQVASPQGGAVQADRYDPRAPFNAALLADADAQAKLADTRRIADLAAADYAAVYVVGGKGAMFDLPREPALAVLIADVYERGGVVAAVCHGPAALAEVRLADGRRLVEGRALTGFSNEEEALFGKRWAAEFPFLLEDAMRERGARWSNAALMLPHLAVDGRLITGQNPYSTPAVAEAIVRALGRTPAARTPWRDEATMALVGRLLAGEAEAARAALADARSAYQAELIGALGYYQLKAAQDRAAVRAALAVLELAAPHVDAPQVPVGIAEARWRLGDRSAARERLLALLAIDPDLAEAVELLARIDE